jgi:glucosylceramidase
MKMNSRAKFQFLSMVFMVVACTPKADWVSSTKSDSWVSEHPVKLSTSTGSFDVQVDTTQKLQIIEGFGACFNELGWTALSRLDPKARDAVFTELFSPGAGANFNLCRMPVGANDFSRDWYSYNETEGDFEMYNFSIDNDKETLIPFIHEALKKNPNMKIWASPWSPPAWMKWNKHYACRIPWEEEELDEKFHNNLPPDRQGAEGTNMFIQEDAYFKAYALYFSKFIEAYKNEGITISAIMPQNEFNSCQIFPSCTWTAGGLAKFIGNYLGPAMEKQHVETMFGTMERPTVAMVDTILNDPKAGKYIKCVGFQWGGKEAIPGVNEKYPDLKLYQTEQECGDGKNDWDYCLYAWSLMKHYFNNGVNAYMYWNMALDEGGYSRWGWQQNSLVTVDTLTNTYRYNYEYYLMKHVSHFVKPGAHLLKTNGEFNDLLAFQNPDKSIVLVIGSDEDKALNIKIGLKMLSPKIKAGSFNTFVIKD